MPDWILQLVGPAVGGLISGLVVIAGLRVEVRIAAASATRAHVRIDDHINQHHVGRERNA